MTGSPSLPRSSRLPGALRLLAVLATATGLIVGDVASAPRQASAADRPSVVLIVTDDQRWDSLWAMPIVGRELVERGVTFVNAFASNPLCCPSRSSILTGLYSHSTGMWRNNPPYGGWSSFDDSVTIATRLDALGYDTGLFGKYLNGYWDGAAMGYVPPGWDRWVAFSRSGYYNYDVSIDGALVSRGSSAEDYSTTYLASEAASFIRASSDPVFVYYAPYAPHGPAVPAASHTAAFADLPPWRPPSWNEFDVSDKPSWLRERAGLGTATVAVKDARRIDQHRTLLSVDEAVGTIVQALADTERLDDTLIVFMSDNGLSWGEHRWYGKLVPYEESIRIPMVMRYDPAATTPRTDLGMALNIDVAPTILELVGLDIDVDGRSLLPALSGGSLEEREGFLIERLRKEGVVVPSYCGVRTRRFKYVYYETGEEELYDLLLDPHEMANVARAEDYVGVVADLRTRLTTLCDPPPPGLSLPAW